MGEMPLAARHSQQFGTSTASTASTAEDTQTSSVSVEQFARVDLMMDDGQSLHC
jgi:hypothetical protein